MRKLFVIFPIILAALFGAPAFASEESPPLYISAFNAGFKDDISSQNYDFIELSRSSEEELDLTGAELRYLNSSGNLAGTITFPEYHFLRADRLVLGFKNSPQYADYIDTIYSYYFSSSGLAATAGALQLWQDETMLDEVCWGKISCSHNVPKFATTATANLSYVRDSDGIFTPQIYHPEINPDAIVDLAPEPEPDSCANLQITEVYSYYTESSAEQFIELFNPSETEIILNQCALRYKNVNYPLSGILQPGQYYAFYDISLNLTKDPTTFNTINIINASGDILSDFVYPHGQKSGTSYAVFYLGTNEEKWLQTYTPTPDAENNYQQFRTCPAGKEINPETGNCIKSQESAVATVCPEGKYLNPFTGRCKKIETAATKICKDGYHLNLLTGRCNKDKESTTTECKEGYERNPDTGRCRKIRTATAQEYPVTPPTEESYDSPQNFTATGVVVALLLGGAVFALFQFRKEIKTAILKICRRNAS